jgi:hypothetical protein
MTMRHYLTYQHNVQKFFRDHRDKYDGVIIPLSIATAFPSGTFGFVRALCSDQTDKSYAIDPRNALFQKSWNRSNVREPHRKMAAALGPAYVDKGLQRPLDASDFADEAALEIHVKQIIDMQLQFSSRSEDARKLEKYKKLLGLSSLGSMRMPQFLMPPYYQFTNLKDAWYKVSQRCAEKAVQYCKGVPVWPVLHYSDWSTIDWTVVSAWLSTEKLREFWFYPNNFKEHEELEPALKAYRSAVEIARGHGLSPYVLFGGYFAVLMSYFGMTGFANGIGYGEWRDSGYHRGGTAATRIYILKLHRYVDAPAAQTLVGRDPDYFGSDSEIIAGYVEAGVSLVNMPLAESLDHFMECRRQELEFVEKQSRSEAVQELAETQRRLKSIGTLESEEYGPSLRRWENSISA